MLHSLNSGDVNRQEQVVSVLFGRDPVYISLGPSDHYQETNQLVDRRYAIRRADPLTGYKSGWSNTENQI